MEFNLSKSATPKNNENEVLETEERALNSPEENSPIDRALPNLAKEISKNTKLSNRSKLVSVDISDVRPNSLNYSKNLGKSDVGRKQGQYVNSESVSPTVRSNLNGPQMDKDNPYLRTETPQLNGTNKPSDI